MLIFSGYILDCFPVTEEMSIEEQLAYIRSLELNPDVIINLKVCTSSDIHNYTAPEKVGCASSFLTLFARVT